MFMYTVHIYTIYLPKQCEIFQELPNDKEVLDKYTYYLTYSSVFSSEPSTLWRFSGRGFLEKGRLRVDSFVHSNTEGTLSAFNVFLTGVHLKSSGFEVLRTNNSFSVYLHTCNYTVQCRHKIIQSLKSFIENNV